VTILTILKDRNKISWLYIFIRALQTATATTTTTTTSSSIIIIIIIINSISGNNNNNNKNVPRTQQTRNPQYSLRAQASL
jgi:hypothetical protein